jgi:hypothetical protein
MRFEQRDNGDENGQPRAISHVISQMTIMGRPMLMPVLRSLGKRALFHRQDGDTDCRRCEPIWPAVALGGSET